MHIDEIQKQGNIVSGELSAPLPDWSSRNNKTVAEDVREAALIF
jgi:hypothetical protein